MLKEPKDVAAELLDFMRQNSALRHRLNIEGAVDRLDGDDAGTLVWTDAESQSWSLTVEQE